MIIGLGHQSRVGKDTLADMLTAVIKRQHPDHYTVLRAGFAWQIKEVAERLYSWAAMRDRLYYEANPHERTTPLPVVDRTPVQLWTAIGDSLTAIHPLTLVEPVLAREPVNGVLIISDVRRESEIDAIHAHGGVVVKVHRPDAPGKVSTADTHLADFANWDYVVVNDGTPADLESQAVHLWNRVRTRPAISEVSPNSTICPVCYSRNAKAMPKFGMEQCSNCGVIWHSTRNQEITKLKAQAG